MITKFYYVFTLHVQIIFYAYNILICKTLYLFMFYIYTHKT